MDLNLKLVKVILIFFSVIFFLPLHAVTPGDFFSNDMENNESPVIQTPTQIGPLLNFSYNLERISQKKVVKFWGIGPGAFFDLNLNNIVTLSVDTCYIFDLSGTKNDMYLKSGIYAKKWINMDWGYTGLGLQTNVIKNKGTSTFSLDLVLLLTGESVYFKNGINTVGDLRITLGLVEPMGGVSVRFQYTLGLGVVLEK
ncbi:MAG: hypothetical protein ABUK01_18495 [Leptospirales bacterium]